MKCVIFGAGKIARGFIGHLLYLSHISFVFIEKNDDLVSLINNRRQYTVNVLGAPQKNCLITDVSALAFWQSEKIVKALAEADLVFTVIGGKNLTQIVPLLAAGITRKAITGKNLNIITCENWKDPADIIETGLKDAIMNEEAKSYLAAHVGVSEAVIMRSAIESGPELLARDPLIVNVSDFWQLPVDASRIVGSLPPIRGLKLIASFAGFLERKIFTYNSANGTASYLGALLGYKILAEAAHDQRVLSVLDGVYQETAQALARKYDISLAEQLEFALESKKKLQDYAIVDTIERNARDPVRKLGRDDRLVGAARLALEQKIEPHNLCIAIAAAIHYINPDDQYAVELGMIRENEGVDSVLSKVCGLEPDNCLGFLIKAKITLLKERGWINE